MDRGTKVKTLKDKAQYKIRLIRKNMKNDIYQMLRNTFSDSNMLTLPMAYVADHLKNIRNLSKSSNNSMEFGKKKALEDKSKRGKGRKLVKGNIK